ncbi:hypothetical protein BJ546DRAFT_98973 [Cryomyces antarcticus]
MVHPKLITSLRMFMRQQGKRIVRLEDGISAGSMYERPSTAMGTLGGPLSDGPPALQRHQTVGKRVLSKVVGGFTNRTRSQQDIRQTEGNLLRRISGKGKRSAGDEAARSRSMDIPVSPSSTTSSFVTVSSLPPTSTTPAEIPRTAHKGHSISPVKTPWTVRKPTMAPSKPPVLSVPPSLLGVDLRVTPEVLLLDVAAEKSIWVAVEVEDSINTPLPATNLSTGLDVVVIVDNSPCISRNTLKSACDLAHKLTELLDQHDDRIAVFCTSCRHGLPNQAAVSGCQLHPLQAVDPQLIEQELQAIAETQCQTQFGTIGPSQTLESAVRVLSESNSPYNNLRQAGGHVFVISPNPTKWSDDFPYLKSVTVHHVCPGVLPWETLPPFGNGWQIISSLGSLPPCDAPSHSKMKTLVSQLCRVIDHARTRSSAHEITDLEVVIKPTTDCTIERIFGDSIYPSLKPGQHVLLFVEVKIPGLQQLSTVVAGKGMLQAHPNYSQNSRRYLERQ